MKLVSWHAIAAHALLSGRCAVRRLSVDKTSTTGRPTMSATTEVFRHRGDRDGALIKMQRSSSVTSHLDPVPPPDRRV